MDFKLSICKENLKRILIIGSVYTAFEILGLILSTLGFFASDIRAYVLAIVIFHLCVLSWILIIKKREAYRGKYWVPWLYSFTVLIWSSLLTSFMYLENRDITLIALVLLITSTFFIIQPWAYLVILSINFIFYVMHVFRTFTEQAYINEMIFKGLLFFGLAYTFCYYHYKNKKESHRLSESLKISNLYLKEQAVRDSLSGLYNNAYIFKYLTNQLKDDTIRELSVLMMDIDNFKRINDTYGHLFGDQVIRIIANTLQHSTEEGDLLGRYGGEEFIVILEHGDVERTMATAEAIRGNIENLVFEHPIKVTISIGIAFHKGEYAEALIKKADEQLYRAKMLGKNRVEKEKEES